MKIHFLNPLGRFLKLAMISGVLSFITSFVIAGTDGSVVIQKSDGTAYATPFKTGADGAVVVAAPADYVLSASNVHLFTPHQITTTGKTNIKARLHSQALDDAFISITFRGTKTGERDITITANATVIFLDLQRIRVMTPTAFKPMVITGTVDALPPLAGHVVALQVVGQVESPWGINVQPGTGVPYTISGNQDNSTLPSGRYTMLATYWGVTDNRIFFAR